MAAGFGYRRSTLVPPPRWHLVNHKPVSRRTVQPR
jgi:hypothetical protein